MVINCNQSPEGPFSFKIEHLSAGSGKLKKRKLQLKDKCFRRL